MLRLIRFLIVLAVTFYVAVIYKSNALIYLGFAELVLAVLCFLYALIGIFAISVSVEAPLGIVESGQKIPVRLLVRNNSIFPSGRVSVVLEEVSFLSKKKRRTTFCTAVEGKNGKKRQAETVIRAEWDSLHTGKTEIRIKKVLCFDLLGIAAFILPKKKCCQKAEIIVMPQVYDMPLETGAGVREFMAEQECYVTGAAEDTPPDDFWLREYQAGDRIRSIHWKLSAKSDEWMVRDHKTVMSCPVLLFLEACAGEQKKKKRLQKREGMYTVLLSLSKALLGQNCSHYIIWYDEKKEDVERYRMEKEEDMYVFLGEHSMAEHYPEGFVLEEAYFEKYCEQAVADKIVLNDDLLLLCNEEIRITYDVEHLKEGVTSQEIFLG